MNENKNDQRKKAKDNLARFSSSDFDKWSESLSVNLHRFLDESLFIKKTIGAFAPLVYEPQWFKSFENEKKWAFPFFENEMCFGLSRLSELEMRRDFGVDILSPPKNMSRVIPEIILVPGLLFSEQGKRLGRGKGFYDRYLEKFCGVKIGICFECQLQENILTEEHDQLMNFIITEKKIYRI